MSHWAIVAAVYGAVLAASALARPVPRRFLAASACLAYLLLALGAGTMRQNIWIGLAAPAALLLGGYWLSGLLFHTPQRRLEKWLLESDRTLFRAMSLDAAIERAPQWTLELLEASVRVDLSRDRRRGDCSGDCGSRGAGAVLDAGAVRGAGVLRVAPVDPHASPASVGAGRSDRTPEPQAAAAERAGPRCRQRAGQHAAERARGRGGGRSPCAAAGQPAAWSVTWLWPARSHSRRSPAAITTRWIAWRARSSPCSPGRRSEAAPSSRAARRLPSLPFRAAGG